MKVIINDKEFEVEIEEYKPLINAGEQKLTLRDKIELPFYRISHRVREFIDKIKYGLQRMFRGYDDLATYSPYSQFIDIFPKVLTDMNNSLHGCPSNKEFDEWQNTLQSMIDSLYYTDSEHIYTEICRQLNVNRNKILIKTGLNEIATYNKDKFMELFSENFFDLWD